MAKARARIDDHHLIAKRAGHGHERLRHMHGADDDEARGRSEHVDEDFAIASRQGHAPVQAEGLGKRRRQIVPEILRRMRERARAGWRALSPAPPCVRAAMSPASRCSTRDASPTPPSSGSTKMRMVPPQASPAFQAVSSSTPNSSTLGLAGGQHLLRLGDHLALDAAARDRAEEIPLAVDRELAADRLRRRAPGLNDGGKRHAPALGQPVERLGMTLGSPALMA